MKLRAQTFRRAQVTVRKPAVAIMGVSTVYVDGFGKELALFAPDTATLRDMWGRIGSAPPFDKRRIQRTAVVRQTALTSKKRLARNGEGNRG